MRDDEVKELLAAKNELIGELTKMGKIFWDVERDLGVFMDECLMRLRAIEARIDALERRQDGQTYEY